MSGPRAVAARSDESRHDRRVTNQEFVLHQPLARSDESAAARDFPLGGRAGARANHRARSLARTPGSRTSSRTSARRKRLETNQTQDVSDLPPGGRVALTIRASPHRRSARRAIRPTDDPSAPRPTTDARIPPLALAQVSDVLSQREGGAGLHPEGARATTPPLPRSATPSRPSKPSTRNQPSARHATHAPPPLSPRHDRKPPPTVPPRSRRTRLASAPTISSPSSASRARSASASSPRRSPSPSSEDHPAQPGREASASRGVYNAAASRGIS